MIDFVLGRLLYYKYVLCEFFKDFVLVLRICHNFFVKKFGDIRINPYLCNKKTRKRFHAPKGLAPG